MQKILITKRIVHLGGYDPMTPDAFFRRFNRELARSAASWGVTASTRDFTVDSDKANWISEMQGPGWRVMTEHELLRWDDVITSHRSRSTLSRWLGGIVSFLDFTVHGAAWRYVVTAWRYAAFFIYPFAALIAVFVFCMLAAKGILTGFGAPDFAVAVLSLAAAFAASFAFVRRGHIGHLLDDWDFARRLVRRSDPVISSRLDAASARMASMPPDTEMMVVGHSLGAVLAAELLDKAMGQVPAPRGVRFVALGSSILKLALHDSAKSLRAQLNRINLSGRISWIEYQSLSDVMNFYKSDPVKLLGLEGPSPLVRQVRFSRMLHKPYYSSIRHNFFRLHCQFISGNDRRAPYDYFVMTCGPFAPESLARSAEGAMGWLAEDGALTAQGQAALLGPSTPTSDPLS